MERGRRAWFHFWFAPSPPEALGMARVFFFGTLFLVYANEDFTGWGAVDPVFWQPIWLFRGLGRGPAPPAALLVLEVLFRGSLLLAAVGLFTRPAAIAACVLGTYLFGLPHNFGHTYHFDALLVFVFLIVACSRAGDGVSVDARRSGIRPEAGPEYTWPIRLVWVAMSLVFFAAGISKLRHGGLEWAASSNFAIVLTKAQYHVSDADPLGPWGLWIASSPIASRALAFMSLATETLFPLALLGRLPRVILVPAAFGMIAGIRILMGPTFGGFLTAFAFWVPWTAVLAWAHGRVRGTSGSSTAAAACASAPSR